MYRQKRVEQVRQVAGGRICLTEILAGVSLNVHRLQREDAGVLARFLNSSEAVRSAMTLVFCLFLDQFLTK